MKSMKHPKMIRAESRKKAQKWNKKSSAIAIRIRSQSNPAFLIQKDYQLWKLLFKKKLSSLIYWVFRFVQLAFILRRSFPFFKFFFRNFCGILRSAPLSIRSYGSVDRNPIRGNIFFQVSFLRRVEEMFVNSGKLTRFPPIFRRQVETDVTGTKMIQLSTNFYRTIGGDIIFCWFSF